MTATDCLEILREIKDVAFATVDKNGMPEVRIIDIMLVEDGKIYFCTARGKDFYQQLINTGRTAITGMNKQYQMIRLNGEVKKLSEQKEWIDRIFLESPSINEVYPGDSRYILEPFCVDNAQIEFFDLGTSPICRKSFTTGNARGVEKGFHITESCIECSACKDVCPQQCIDAAQPYVIRQENCLHCGLCYEKCPVEAIIKGGF